MNLKNILDKLSKREMDRKDFLKYSGLVLAGVVGLKGLIDLLSTGEQVQKTTATRSFGNGKYGR